ncbi:lactate racemase domain-containing protein [Natribaculum luteum]|uniref:Lactate racemase domain-containing protein n=1 Tax=Natribaculum luteum TaxID=1586232 RepID=A0ABD5NWG9_9EURY|nr:lactate racemase domain-containing protein [Natribaculum luteum]
MEFPDPDEIAHLIDPQPYPSFARVSYDPPTETLPDLLATVRSELDRLPLDDLEPGATVAVGVGSRGIHRLDDVVTETITSLEERGFDPVVVPAMGSHGGATPEGQREILAALDITEDRIGAPIDARMDVEKLAEVDVGGTTTPVYLSAAALEADAVLVINRVKPHTNFTGRIESGLCKMLTVGLGKQRGAQAFHSTAIEQGYVPTIESLVAAIRDAAPVLGGLAIVENFHEETGHLEAIPASSLEDREPDLLERARNEMATLPEDDIDLLVVDELGKEISGAGMDTNVIGRYRVLNAPDPEDPSIKLIYARGLTAKTSGNGNGIGLADITRRAAVEQLDLRKTYANALTSGSLAKAKLPPVAPNDELALRIALNALGGYDPETARVAWIENTTDLAEFYVSDALLEEIVDDVTVRSRARLTFDDGTAEFERV